MYSSFVQLSCSCYCMKNAPAPLIRPATSNDLAGIVALTKARRRQLAVWEPWYWNPREGVDEMHPMFLGWCIEHNPNCHVSVAIEGGNIVGCLFAQHRLDHTFLDDFCVVEERWQDIGSALIDASIVANRLICAPMKDRAQHVWLGSTSFSGVSTFFSFRTPVVAPSRTSLEVVPLPEQLERPPAHVFGLFDAGTENGLRVSTVEGYAIGSAPILPPPYDPGGPTSVIDRVVGKNRRVVLEVALQEATRRGDVHVIVVVDHRDLELTEIVNDLGATQPVKLWCDASRD
jgi:hypothetical protein